MLSLFKPFYIKSILCLAIAFSTFEAQSQNINLADLFKLHELNRDQIDDFMIQKSFSVSPSYAISRSISIHKFNSNNNKNGVYRSISLHYCLEAIVVRTSYTTISQQEYAALKNQVKSRGYDFTTSYPVNDGNNSNRYENKASSKYIIDLSQMRDLDAQEVLYNITVTDKSPFERCLNFDK